MFKIVDRAVVLSSLALLLCSCASRGVEQQSASSSAFEASADTSGLTGLRPATADAMEKGEDRVSEGVRTRSEAVPTGAEIFDFHPPGSRPGSWREPFVVSYTEGPLNAYRLRTLAELQRLKDHRYDLVPR